MHFCADSDNLWLPSHRDVNTGTHFLELLIAEGIFTVEFWEIVNVKITIGNRLDNRLLDPVISRENIKGTSFRKGHTLRLLSSDWRDQHCKTHRTAGIDSIKAVHDLVERTSNVRTDGELVVLHRGFKSTKAIIQPLNYSKDSMTALSVSISTLGSLAVRVGD